MARAVHFPQGVVAVNCWKAAVEALPRAGVFFFSNRGPTSHVRGVPPKGTMKKDRNDAGPRTLFGPTVPRGAISGARLPDPLKEAAEHERTLERERRVAEGERRFGAGDIEGAARAWERALAFLPADHHLHNRVGDAYSRSGRTVAAIEHWQAAASLLEAAGFHQKAYAVLAKVFKVDASRLDVLRRLADLCVKMGRPLEARRHYETLADRLVCDGRKLEAISVYAEADRIDDGDMNSQIALARIYADEGRDAEAIACYSKIGRMLLASGHLDDAMRWFEKAAAFPHAEPATFLGIARLLRERGEPKAAHRLLTIGCERLPRDIRILLSLREVALDLGEEEEADEMLARAADLSPEDDQVSGARADACLRSGKVEEAYRRLRVLADAALARGDALRAVQLLAPILRYDPDHLPTLRACLGYYQKIFPESVLPETREAGARVVVDVSDDR